MKSQSNASTTEKGNSFRTRILHLLRTKYRDATTEVPTSWKRADIVFSKVDFGRTFRVAVECKNYQKKLTTADFKSIWGDYESALSKQEIQTVLVISCLDIEAGAQSFLRDHSSMVFMTEAALEEWMIGLRPYIESMQNAFTSDDVHEYYVDGRFVNVKETAFDCVRNWIASPSNSGLAILGGYGVGKSSLAKRIAADQARRYLSSPATERMPILLKLGQVVHETELSALFGKEFTSEHLIEGYSYKTLMHLNECGRLLIVLDGFDEMKHAMTEADFRANFREFNKLRVGNSKVMLLGRPSALSSDSANHLLRGLSTLGGQTYQDQDFEPWIEQSIDFFSIEESRQFLTNFLLSSAKKRKETANREVVTTRVTEILADINEDLLQRPVQARIVGQLAATPNYSFKNLNRFRLYSDFVDRMISREQEKRARAPISQESRRKFVEELAWWAWNRKDAAQGYFRKDEVPQSMFDSLESGNAVSILAKRAEYLVASLTDQKEGDVLYFAHRSFQEFLVASKITKLEIVDDDTLAELHDSLNSEVFDFLHEAEHGKYLELIFDHLDSHSRGPVKAEFLTLMRRNFAVERSLSSSKPQHFNIFDVVVAGYSQSQSAEAAPHDNTDEFLTQVVTSAKIDAAAVALLCLLIRARENKELYRIALAAAWSRVMLGLDAANIGGSGSAIDATHFGLIGRVLRDFSSKTPDGNEFKLSFELRKATIFLLAEAKKMGITFNLELAPLESNISSFSVAVTAISRTLTEESEKTFLKVWAKTKNNFLLVERIEKARARAK